MYVHWHLLLYLLTIACHCYYIADTMNQKYDYPKPLEKGMVIHVHIWYLFQALILGLVAPQALHRHDPKGNFPPNVSFSTRIGCYHPLKYCTTKNNGVNTSAEQPSNSRLKARARGWAYKCSPSTICNSIAAFHLLSKHSYHNNSQGGRCQTMLWSTAGIQQAPGW